MDNHKLTELLKQVSEGRCSVEDAVTSLQHLPGETMGFACLDHHRQIRTGLPEVVYGENKSCEQIVMIMGQLLKHTGIALATRIDAAKAELVCRELPLLEYYGEARMLVGNPVSSDLGVGRGTILVIAAGTSDIPVAEEARVTAASLGHHVEQLYDVGVAGIHRLLAGYGQLRQAKVLVVVAGMEGALPSVVGGLVDRPVVAVPTSVGYGTGFGGIAALLGMLNSCTPGVAVVNIDNGFGAGCLAATINRI
ncbi:MAG: nickel pincer cofactor biosynthesis protein LarB [Proteobacteria bacterium]|nr:nickel pincer cofactor biosynthesis protein LarB [Pseudomonadota bacterium]MBU1685733.1 nickel pincer cofactor biosynthesis protein LarB [Pseudomonadota bacterium]